MSSSPEQRAADFYAQTYDDSVPDWPGEIDFYIELASENRGRNESVLEIACGTGRVTIRLAQEGIRTVGLDRSTRMLEVAREKSKDIPAIQWVQADMRQFSLGETFGLVLIPGHSFQNLNTPQDQSDCIKCIHRALVPEGRLVMHLDHMNLENAMWLGDLARDKGGVFEPAEQFRHAKTGRFVKAARAWSYEPASQTAVCTTAWEEINEDGYVVERWKTEPVRLHVIYRFEMEHILRGAGFEVEAVYGDFFRSPLEDISPSMVWLAKKIAN